MQFETAVRLIFELEGGLTDDPRDPGGLTNFGISLRSHPKLGREGIINLTREKAAAIYRKDYWDAARCDDFPEDLRLAIFDSAVNQGVKAATRILQALLRVTVDGIIGPQTLRAARAADPRRLLINFLAERGMRYVALATFKTFGLGWMRRLFQVALETTTPAPAPTRRAGSKRLTAGAPVKRTVAKKKITKSSKLPTTKGKATRGQKDTQKARR